mgnify:CR=1 FL=1
MKRAAIIVILIAALFIPSIASAAEAAPNREVVERLIKLEEGQKAILREMDKRFEAVDKRLDQMINIFIAIVAAFSAIVATTVSFAIWDRRTMIRPFETKVKKIEDEITENRNRLNDLLTAFKTLGKSDKKVAEILKRFNLL